MRGDQSDVPSPRTANGNGPQAYLRTLHDYAHQNRPRTMTLDGAEFLRRFLMHAVPRSFKRIRHFGLFANRVRTENLAICRRLLDEPVSKQIAVESVFRPVARQTCPVCQRGHLIPGPNLSPWQLNQLRIRLDTS